MGEQIRLGRAVTAIAAAITSVVLVAAPGASAASRPSLDAPGIQSTFDWQAKDYAVRQCDASPPQRQVSVTGAKGWVTAVDDADLRSGSYLTPITAVPGESITVRFKKRGKKAVRRYHLRCLPHDFPLYTFEREGNRTGGPPLFGVQVGNQYGAVFDSNGTPVWWVRADGLPNNFGFLPDGTLTWSPVDQAILQTSPLEVRTIRNKLLHRFTGAPGTAADVHELLLLPNGNYMFGAQRVYSADTSAYGGSPNSKVTGIEIQEFTPEGKEVYSWFSRGHIGFEETGRWWDSPILGTEPYDVVHFNAVENARRFMLLSMRHTDAIYKINKRTGDVVWKLGGTPTPESLKVIGDPKGAYPFGGQHDVRFDGDHRHITLYDNQTDRPDTTPRAVRYKINQKRGTARLVDSITDPEVEYSACCGSVKHLGNGDWFIGFGGNSDAGIAAYDASGRRIYRLTLDGRFSYRARAVPKGTPINRKKLRKAMDDMAARAG